MNIDIEFVKGLDVIYNFYLENKFEDMVDHILIAVWLALHEAPLPPLNKIFITKSNIEGLGVFALRDIKKGEIVSMYPSEVILYDNNLYLSDRIKKYENKYHYKINNYSIAGVHFNDTNFCGHILNDVCQSDGTKEGDDKYNKMSILNNCMYHPYKDIFILIVACKDVKIGEELTVSYQTDYWKVISKLNDN